MRRVTGLVVTGLCVCGSAFAQSGNPLVVPGPRSAAHSSEDRTDHRLTRGLEHDTAMPAFSSRAADRPFGEDFAPPTTADGSFDRARTILQSRLAAIGRLRAAAMENGDAELLQHAERLEHEARRQLQAHPAADAPFRPSHVSPSSHASQPSSPSHASHHTAAYEHDPSASSEFVTPASGHPIGGFREGSSAARSGNTGEFGLPAAVNLGSGERSFEKADDDSDARFYSRRRNASELPRSNADRSETWYGAAPRGPQDTRPAAAAPRMEEPAFAQPVAADLPASSATRTGSRGLGADLSAEPAFAPAAPRRHAGADAHQDDAPLALPRSGEWDRPSPGATGGTAAAANPFAQPALDSRATAASPFADEPEFPTSRGTARSAAPARSAQPFDPRSPGDTAPAENPFAAHTPAEPPLPSRRDPGLPAAAAPRRSAGLVYGSESAADTPSRRFALPRPSDSPLYYGRDPGQATTAEARGAGRDFGLTTASGTRSRIPIETAPGGDDPFGEPPGTSISGASDRPARARGDDPTPSKAGESKPAKPKRGLFSWFGRRGQSEK